MDKRDVKQAVKEVLSEFDFQSEIMKALSQHKHVKKSQVKKLDPDLISTNQAYKLRGESRVDKLIELGLLKRISSGNSRNSPKYISKKQLFKLDNTYL
jgi:hypothetical protein